MINQVYNMFFGEAFESDEQEAELIKDADPFLMETESIPNDLGTVSDIQLEDLPSQIETPQDLPDFSVSSEITSTNVVPEQPVKRKRGRPPKIPRQTPGAPSSSTPKVTPKSTTKSRTPSVFFSKNSPLPSGDADGDLDLETTSVKYKRRRTNSTASYGLPSTPSSLPVTPSGNSAFTRRSQRGRHIDVSRDLVLLFPDDNISVKLDIKDPFELEQCLAALAEDTTQDWSDQEESATGHGHGQGGGGAAAGVGGASHRFGANNSNSMKVGNAGNITNGAFSAMATSVSNPQLEAMSTGSTSEKSGVLPHQKEEVFVPPVRDVPYPYEQYSSHIINNNPHLNFGFPSGIGSTASTNNSRSSRKTRQQNSSNSNLEELQSHDESQNGSNSSTSIDNLKRVLKKQKGYVTNHSLPNTQFYKNYQDVYLDYDCDSDDEHFLVNHAPPPTVPPVLYSPPIASTPFQHFTIGGSSLPGTGHASSSNVSAPTIQLNHLLLEQCIVRLEKEYELLKQFLVYYQDFSRQQQTLQTNFIHSQKLYALTKEYAFQNNQKSLGAESPIEYQAKTNQFNLKGLLQEMLDVSRPSLSLPTLANSGISIDQFQTPSATALLQAKAAAERGKGFGAGGSSSSDGEELLPSFAITMPAVDPQKKENDSNVDDDFQGQGSNSEGKPYQCVLGKLFPWSHAYPILLDVLTSAQAAQTQLKKALPENKKELVKLCRSIYHHWLTKHPDTIKPNTNSFTDTSNPNNLANSTNGNWQPSQSLLRAYHRYIMHLWQFPEDTQIAYQLPYATNTTILAGYERLATIRHDLDRTRLIIDRVRRREKLKKEILKVNQEILEEELYMTISEVYFAPTLTSGSNGTAVAAIINAPIDASPVVPVVRKRGRPRRIDPNAPSAHPLILSSPMFAGGSTQHYQLSFSPAATTPSHPPAPLFSFPHSALENSGENGTMGGQVQEQQSSFYDDVAVMGESSGKTEQSNEAPPTPSRSDTIQDVGSPTITVEYVVSPGGTPGMVKFIQGRDRFGKFLKKAPVSGGGGGGTPNGNSIGNGNTVSSTPNGSNKYIGSPLPLSSNGCMLSNSSTALAPAIVLPGTASLSVAAASGATTYRRKVLRKQLCAANLQNISYTILEEEERKKSFVGHSAMSSRQLPIHCPYDSDNADNILTFVPSTSDEENEEISLPSQSLPSITQHATQSRRTTRSAKSSASAV